MKNKLIILSILTLAFFGMTSCTPIFLGMYGMNSTQTLDEEGISHYAEKYNIPLSECFELDTAYHSFLLALDTNLYKQQMKNHYQPLQAPYYDNAGDLRSFHVNCNTGGFPNLDWERDEIMTSFPPKEQTQIDSIVTLKKHLEFLIPLSQTEEISPDNYNYIVILHWSRFMGRQSRRLIKTVQENSELATAKKVKILYANTDNLFAKQSEELSRAE